MSDAGPGPLLRRATDVPPPEPDEADYPPPGLIQSPAARAFIVFIAAVIGTAIVVVMLLVGTVGNTESVKRQSEENGRLLEDTAAILRVVLAVTGCTVNDTAKECAARTAANSGAGTEGILAEIDCRIRRAVDRLPAVAAGTNCLAARPTIPARP